jgi:high-affinity Fe2+/Pb2+ permease
MENSIYDIENGFSRKVSNIALWMSVGLFVSAFVAAYIYFTGIWYDLAISFNGYGFILLLV